MRRTRIEVLKKQEKEANKVKPNLATWTYLGENR